MMAIKRIWRGWTTPENAEPYRLLLQQEVITFMGEDYEKAYLPEAALALLERWDEFCAHYEVFGD